MRGLPRPPPILHKLLFETQPDSMYRNKIAHSDLVHVQVSNANSPGGLFNGGKNEILHSSQGPGRPKRFRDLFTLHSIPPQSNLLFPRGFLNLNLSLTSQEENIFFLWLSIFSAKYISAHCLSRVSAFRPLCTFDTLRLFH